MADFTRMVHFSPATRSVGTQTAQIGRPLTNSKNIVYKKPKPRRGRRRQPKATKSFKNAYNLLLPKKELRTELQKSLDTSAVPNNVVGASAVGIIQGTQLNQRLQSGIHVSYLHWRGTAQSNSTVKTKYLRFIVLKQANSNGTLLDVINYSNMLTGPTFGTAALSGIQKDIQYQIDREAYRVFLDKVISIRPEHDGNIYFNWKVKINTDIHYPRAAPLSTTPENGNLFCICLLADGDSLPSGTIIDLDSEIRTFFKDTTSNTPEYWRGRR